MAAFNQGESQPAAHTRWCRAWFLVWSSSAIYASYLLSFLHRFDRGIGKINAFFNLWKNLLEAGLVVKHDDNRSKNGCIPAQLAPCLTTEQTFSTFKRHGKGCLFFLYPTTVTYYSVSIIGLPGVRCIIAEGEVLVVDHE